MMITTGGINFAIWSNRQLEKRKATLLFVVVVVVVLLLTIFSIVQSEEDVAHYSNIWMAKIVGGKDKASEIVSELGFELQQSSFSSYPDLYKLVHLRHPKKGKYRNKYLTEKLLIREQVVWAQQVSVKKRQVRSFTCPRQNGNARSNYMETFNDILWLDQWYMHDCRSVDDSLAGRVTYDLNVVPAYYKLQVTGYGIVVLIVDDGVEINHVDIAKNYDKTFGIDLVDNDDIPEPVHTKSHTFHHGTRCAGQIGMIPDNYQCGVGIAPLATLGAVRLVSEKPVNDLQEAEAMTFKAIDAHISNNSWGPNDDGKVMPHMGNLTKSAMQYGIQVGRKGKGMLYVFAAGNGKESDDNCSCDVFVTSIYTIAVASADELGQVTPYSERCSSILVTTYSAGKGTEYKIITTDVNNECTRKHTGTSASAPIVSGVLALLLELNENLTWRDVQHLLVITSEIAPLENNYGWHRNSAGFYYSHDFGFGAINAYNLLLRAKNFVTVPPMSTCIVPVNLRLNEKSKIISRLKGLRIKFESDGCNDLPAEINYIEHVQLLIDITYTRRGDLQCVLTSPEGTRSHLLMSRSKDSYTKGINNWSLNSVHFWGEAPQGYWTAEFFDNTGWSGNHGELIDMMLVIYGTKEMPDHYQQQRTYSKFKLPKEMEDG